MVRLFCSYQILTCKFYLKPLSEASTCRTNGKLKSGYANTWVLVTVVIRYSKNSCYSFPKITGAMNAELIILSFFDVSDGCDGDSILSFSEFSLLIHRLVLQVYWNFWYVHKNIQLNLMIFLYCQRFGERGRVIWKFYYWKCVGRIQLETFCWNDVTKKAYVSFE